MLSERLNSLFTLLQCNNTEIAGYAGCSPSHISRFRTGSRNPRERGRAVEKITTALYRYAAAEKLLPELCGLLNTKNDSEEVLIPAMIDWLYNTEQFNLPPSKTPMSKQIQKQAQDTFAINLSNVMSLLKLTNAKLASALSMDPSIISRYKNGVLAPPKNEPVAEKLCEILCARAAETGKTAELAELCGKDEESLNPDFLHYWLLYPTVQKSPALAETVLYTIENFSPTQSLLPFVKKPPVPPRKSCYYGTEGLRQAVIRFLSKAAKAGGELLLYSDEPMDWMIADKDFFAIWATLMVNCVQHNVTVKIIHNMDRKAEEMGNAITGWFPLYASGKIEPYVYQKLSKPRFFHTFFLHKKTACIHGQFPIGAKEERFYDYITDPNRLEVLEREFKVMLSNAKPFLKIYSSARRKEYHEFYAGKQAPDICLLSGLPLITMPEDLFYRILKRCKPDKKAERELTDLYKSNRAKMLEKLKKKLLHVVLFNPEENLETAPSVNFKMDMYDLSAVYTKKEYIEHIEAVRRLAQTETNFQLTVLTSSPFKDVQIVSFSDSFIVLRNIEPYGAFVFMNYLLAKSVQDFLLESVYNQHSNFSKTIKLLKGWYL
ncbi:MAG: hypothetical protein IJ073_00015 [Lachnospiraceae bacterium]|nr:hypothetical protein [Lachnospiraceae bacterium]